MRTVGAQFAKKLLTIMDIESLTMSQLGKLSGVPYRRIYEYVHRNTKTNPSVDNILKVVDAFPKYTCYILDLESKHINKQIFPKD